MKFNTLLLGFDTIFQQMLFVYFLQSTSNANKAIQFYSNINSRKPFLLHSMILIFSSSCYNQTCRLIDSNQLDHLLIYAIPIHKEHENFAHYLINRSDSCIPISRAIYRLWLQWTLNMTARTQLFHVGFNG